MAQKNKLIYASNAIEMIRLDAERIPDDLSRIEAVAYKNGMSAAVASIASCQTVDAVEVVRCKDCKHSVWDEENEMWKCVESAELDEDAGEWFGF